MKIANLGKTMLLGLGLLLATSAFAANKGALKLFGPATVGGKQLPAGEYSVVWQGEGSNVDVKILKGSQVIATAPARVVTLQRTPDSDGTSTKASGEKGTALTGIFFRGKTQALVLDQTEAMEVAGGK
jgi:hypothetical protein